MGSILNFVITDCDKINRGPFYNYIQSHLKHTSETDIDFSNKNILVIESDGELEDNSCAYDYIEKYKDTNIKFIIPILSDPPITYKIRKIKNKIKGVIDSNRIIILSSNINLKGKNVFNFDYFLEESTWNQYEHFFSKGRNQLNYVSKDIRIDELNTFRSKKFLSFNRNINKTHRFNLLHLFLKYLKDESIFSFLLYDGEQPETYVKEDFEEDWNRNIPIILDSNGKLGFRTTDTFKKELFLDSCVHIVTETSFEENELFISEKIIKPILMYQPFIVLGSVGYLERLKSYGFKTFSDFWDESYDTIKNPRKRYKKVRELILSLNKMSIEEMNELYQKTKEICIFNRQLHQSMYINSIPKILEEIENEW